MHDRPTRRVFALLTALVLAAAVAACGSSGSESSATSSSTAAGGQPGAGRPTVTIGSKNFTEEIILGQLCAQALQAKGYHVALKGNLGSSEIVDKALTSDQIDFYPEYTGTILAELAHQNSRPASAAQAYQRAKTFEQSRGFTLLAPTPFFDTDALAVKPAYASANGLRQIGDLRTLGSRATLAGPPEFRTRFQGLVGLRQLYGLDQLKFAPLAIGLQYKALDTGRAQVTNVFTTDGQLQRGSYTLLADPKNVFGFQNVTPVVSRKVLAAEGPAFAQTLNAVSAKLTTEAVRRMNAAVDIDKNDPAQVASQFLQANGLK